MTHPIFYEDQDNFEWIASLEGHEQTVQKVFNIIVERSGLLYNDDDTLMWFREIFGYVLEEIEEGELSITRDLLKA
jgi:hypothetical protein